MKVLAEFEASDVSKVVMEFATIEDLLSFIGQKGEKDQTKRLIIECCAKYGENAVGMIMKERYGTRFIEELTPEQYEDLSTPLQRLLDAQDD